MFTINKIKSNGKLIESLVNIGVLKKEEIINAFLTVDRKDFVPEKYKDVAYVDSPIPLGYGSTISQPYTVAFMLEKLQPNKGNNVLDVGSGSGWTTCLLAEIIGKEGHVIGTEIIPELIETSRDNISKYSYENVEFILTPESVGFKNKSPYDRILVSAASNKIPSKILEQLDINGILVIPVKNSIFKLQNDNFGNITKNEFNGFAFVSLRNT